MQRRGDRVAGVLDMLQVRLAVGIEWGRHADHHHIAAGKPGFVGAGFEATLGDQGLQIGRRNIGDIALAAVELGHALCADVDAKYWKPCPRCARGQRHADVAQADHADGSATVFDFCMKVGLIHSISFF